MAGTFAEELASAARNGACAVMGNAPTLPRLFRRFAPGLLVPIEGTGGLLYGFPPFFDFPEFVYRSLCNTEPPPRPVPGFSGGQCVNERYNIQVFGARFINQGVCDEIPWASSQPQVWGPILAVYLKENSPGVSPSRVICLCNGVTGFPPRDEPVEVSLGNFASTAGCPPSEIRSIIIVPVGHADDCGDTDLLPIPPPSPGDDTVTIPDFTYTDNSQTDINLGDLNVTVESPRIDVNARINIPIRFTLAPNINIRGNLNLGGELNIFPGTGSGRGGQPGTPDDAAPTEPVPEPPISIPNEPEDPADDDLVPVIIGVAVTTKIVDRITATEINQNGNPTIYAPRIGSVSFLIEFAAGETGWTEDIDVKNLRQVIECPWPLGAIDVRGTAAEGVEQTLTPIQNLQQAIIPLT